MKGVVLRIAKIFISCALALIATAARGAETPPAEAKRHANACVKAFDLAEYDRAIKECKAAYEIFPAPLLLFSIGQAYRKLGDHGKALAFYRTYLAKAPNGSQRKVAEEHVVQLTTLIESAERTRNAPPPDSVMPSESSTTDRAPSMAERAPSHVIGSHPTSSAQPARATIQSTKTERWYRRPLAVAGFALLGVGFTTVAASGGILAAANASTSEANRALTLEEKRSLEDKASSLRIGGYAALGIAGVVLVGGATMVGVIANSRRDPPVHLSLVFDPSYAFVSVRGALW
jgi:tetratricopeptide (TPR) repeat protein